MSLRVPNGGTWADVVGIDISYVTSPPSSSPPGGRDNPKVSIGVGPIEVEIPIDGESVNREDASGSNQNGN